MAVPESPDPEKARKKIRLIGLITALFAVAGAIWPLAILPIFMQQFGHEPSSFADGTFNFGKLFIGVCIAQAALCSILFIGAMLFRALRNTGRVIILVLTWVTLIYCIIFTLSVPFIMFFVGFPVPMDLLFSFMAIVNGAFWGVLLWFPIRYLSRKAKLELAAAHEATK